MDTNKMREQFEEFIRSQAWYFGDTESSLERDSENSESYVCPVVEGARMAWQASREAVVVELPKIFPDNSVSCVHSKCARAIEAHGLKVAP